MKWTCDSLMKTLTGEIVLEFTDPLLEPSPASIHWVEPIGCCFRAQMPPVLKLQVVVHKMDSLAAP